MKDLQSIATQIDESLAIIRNELNELSKLREELYGKTNKTNTGH